MTNTWNSKAPFYIVKVIRGSNHYWTRDTWSPCYWDAQRYCTSALAYRAAARAELGIVTIEQEEPREVTETMLDDDWNDNVSGL